eukprot:5283649-Prymnesium_polylepis.1
MPARTQSSAVRRLVHPLDRGADERQADAGLFVRQAPTSGRHRVVSGVGPVPFLARRCGFAQLHRCGSLWAQSRVQRTGSHRFEVSSAALRA